MKLSEAEPGDVASLLTSGSDRLASNAAIYRRTKRCTYARGDLVALNALTLMLNTGRRSSNAIKCNEANIMSALSVFHNRMPRL